MKKRDILDEINCDLELGIYDRFPRLKKRIEFIADKLAKSIYVANCELSRNEIETLKENDYIQSIEVLL